MLARIISRTVVWGGDGGGGGGGVCGGHVA